MLHVANFDLRKQVLDNLNILIKMTLNQFHLETTQYLN